MRYCSIFSIKNFRRNNFRFSLFIFVILIIASCSFYKSYIINNYHLNVDPEIRRPGFWIAQLDNPDKLIMGRNEIESFNNKMIKKGLVKLFNRGTLNNIKSADIKKEIVPMYNYLHSKKRYNNNGAKADDTFYKSIYKNLDIDNIKENCSFGFVIKFSNQRLIPSKENLFDNPIYHYFDRNQNNGLDIGEPIIIAHKSHDNKWFYVLSKYSSGWVESNNVVKADYSDIILLDKLRFIVITAAKADLYDDLALTLYNATTRMGNRYMLTRVFNKCYEILIPQKDKKGYIYYKKFYINKNDATIGYLPYTQRKILLQAFEMLNAPYGWGDMAQEQDCSKFIQQIFFTFGITLPRNSYGQAKSGINIYREDINNKVALNEIFKNGLKVGITTIQIPGHIMLYIGDYKNEHYVIHDLFGANIRVSNRKHYLIVNKVEVTPLSLGKDAKDGSLYDRIKNINRIEGGSIE